MKVGMISLGCSKNQVDSEMILGSLKEAGFEITTVQDEADLIIINTCAFIEDAKVETIKAINETISDKKENAKVVVCGCFAERYAEVLKESFPEIDLVIPLRDYPHFKDLIQKLMGIPVGELSFNHRVLISSSVSPYVRIADGCNNHCAFCAIPLIRGKYISRSIEDILSEVQYLVKNGAKEINLVAQDTSKYGTDNYHQLMLSELLRKISSIEGIFLIRTFYIYPETINDELIDVIKTHDNIAPYFDIPFQHASNKILKLMKRRSTREENSELISKIKKEIPQAIIRTTLMVGFPGENSKDFKELLSFVEETKFFHMGAFMYSREENTKAYSMKKRVPKFIMKKRYNQLMKTQEILALEEKKKLIGNTYQALVTGYDEENYSYILRNYMFAPDDVDGAIYATCPFENNIQEGDIVQVKIIDADPYNLYGEIVKTENENEKE